MSGERNGDAIAVDGGSSSGYARPSGKRSGRPGTRRNDGGNGRSVGTATLPRPKQTRLPASEPRRRANPLRWILRFFGQVVTELRKVIWPSRRQMVSYTTVVLVFVAVMVALIYGLDFGFVKGVDWLFG